jgi:hypothetical protein
MLAVSYPETISFAPAPDHLATAMDRVDYPCGIPEMPGP